VGLVDDVHELHLVDRRALRVARGGRELGTLLVNTVESRENP
jgi:hypothetical protein